MHPFILFSILLVATILIERYPSHVKNLTIPNNLSTKSCILLTMHASTPQRERMYNEVLMKWINYTSLPIFTVDSAASPRFAVSTHKRWKSLSFSQGDSGLKSNDRLELEAIVKAESYFDFRIYDVVVKVTGKYFVPQLESLLSSVPKGLVLQNRNSFMTRHQNSELFGFPPGYSKYLLNGFNTKAEKTLYEFSRFIGQATRLPKLDVNTRYPRSDGSVLTWL